MVRSRGGSGCFKGGCKWRTRGLEEKDKSRVVAAHSSALEGGASRPGDAYGISFHRGSIE